APAGDDTGLGTLGDVLAALAETLRPATALDAVAVVETDVGTTTLDDVALAARALRRLVGDARDLDARDLAEPGTTDAASGLDPDDLAARADALRAALAAGRGALAAALPPTDSDAPQGD